MIKCLCCNKEISVDSSEQELITRWHHKCIKSFFGTQTMPYIDISEEKLRELAYESTSHGYCVPGVQKKLSLHLTDEKKHTPRLTLVNYPNGYILKPSTVDYPSLPESEQLVMSMADSVGIKTVPHALIMMDSKYAYITKRVDRLPAKGTTEHMKMLAMEDFCQLDGRLTEDKYKGSYERCAKIINKYSSMPKLDMTEFFLRIVFSFITGNSDMHLKNFSLIESSEGSCSYSLSPAYDLLPVNIILPEDISQMALTLNGKNRNIRRHDFLDFANSCGISESIAKRLIDSIFSKKDALISQCEESNLPEKMKTDFLLLIESRIDTILK